MFQQTVLPNGLKIITEKISGFQAVSLGIWVRVGARLEQDTEAGFSHFLEHMMFKGTRKRTARQIAAEMDEMGGHLDASTGHEHTCFYARVLPRHFERAISILADIIRQPLLNRKDIETEKKVVAEEIRMYNDSPVDSVYNLFLKSIWNRHPLARPILGENSVILKISSQALNEFFRRHYQPSKYLISAAGNVKHERAVELAKKFLGDWDGKTPRRSVEPPVFQPSIVRKDRELEQIHLCIGANGLAYGHPDRYKLIFLANLLGGGMSSRLFQEIREKRGLVYSIGCHIDAYHDTGVFEIYAGLSPEKINKVWAIILREIERLKKHFITKEELRRSKEQLKDNFLLSLESTDSRMVRLATQTIYLGRVKPVDEFLKGISKITPDDVRKTAKDMFSGGLGAAVLGPGAETINLPPM